MLLAMIAAFAHGLPAPASKTYRPRGAREAAKPKSS